MTVQTDTSVTRRQVLVAGGSLAGYTLSVETVLAQAGHQDRHRPAPGNDHTRPVACFGTYLEG
jgi:hypothetical protein